MYSDKIHSEKLKPIKKKIKSVIVRPSTTYRCELTEENSLGLEGTLIDITCQLERFQMTIVNKALTISPFVHETTLGPKVETKNHSAESTFYKNTIPSKEPHISQTNSGKQDYKERHSSKVSLDAYIARETPRRCDKLLFELDQQRKRNLAKSINERFCKTVESYKATQDSRASHGTITDLRVHLDHKRVLQDDEEKAAEVQHKHGEMLALQQKQQYEREKAAQFAEKVQREQEDKRMILEFKQHEREFRQSYQLLSESLKCCSDKQALFASNTSSFSTIKTLDDGMTQLAAQVLAGEMNHLVLQKASAIIRQFETYSKILQEEVKKVNRNVLEIEKEKIAHQQREKAAQELQKKEAAAAAYAAATAAAATAAAAAVASAAAARAEEAVKQQLLPPKETKVIEELHPTSVQPANAQSSKKINLGYLEGCVDASSFQAYKGLKTYLAEFQSSFYQLSHDPQYKDFTFNCKKAVNIPVNAIGDQSGEHLLDKFHRLSTLLKGGTVHLSDVPFRATGHPQGIHFCMDLLASKLVDQGKTTVSSRAETAFPIAAIIVALWVEIPAFGQVIQAHFFKACPYLVPIFFPQVEGQSDEEYWKSRGYQFENGRPEKEATFVKKMSGIMQLYAAVIVSNVRRQQRAPHPLGMTEGWRWISCMINIAPQPAISATLLLTFLEVTGNAMLATYQHQFQKVLHLICKDYLLKMKATDIPGAGGYVSRLEGFLHTMLKNGGIAPPKGALPAHFW